MNIIEYAENELRIIKHKNVKGLSDLVGRIAGDHSGFSIGFAINAIKNNKLDNEDVLPFKQEILALSNQDREYLIKLLRYQPLSELTLKDDEWTKYEWEDIYMNKRMFSLTKDSKGNLQIHGKLILINQNGLLMGTNCFTLLETREEVSCTLRPRQFLEFPSVFINCLDRKIADDDYETVVSKHQLDKIRKVYDVEIEVYNNAVLA